MRAEREYGPTDPASLASAASRLTGIDSRKILRWLRGYKYHNKSLVSGSCDKEAGSRPRA